MSDPFVVRIISLGFMLLFVLAAAHKLTGLATFQAVLTDYRLLPPTLVPLIALAVPVLELLLGVGWLISAYTPTVAYTSAGLLTAYTVAMGINLIRGRVHIGCGCGFGGASPDDQPLSVGLLLRNVVLVIVALLATFPVPERQLGIVDNLTLVAALLASTLLYAAANQLLQNGAAISSWRKVRKAKRA